jgi:hypothetical protein
LSPGTLGERVVSRRNNDPPPPFTDIAHPGGIDGRIGLVGINTLTNMVEDVFGVPLNSRPLYKQLGTANILIPNGQSEVSSQGLVTIYDKPLVNDDNEFLLQGQEIFIEGDQTIVSARIPTILFGHPDNVIEREGDPIPYGDKVLKNSDISYLSYHAFFYVDINRMMADMELDDE